MAFNVLPIAIDLAARGFENATEKTNRLAAALQGAGQSAATARQKFANLAGAFSAIVTARMIGGVIKSFTDPAIAWQRSLVKLQNIIGGTTEQLNRMAEAAKQAALKTAFSPQQALDALIELRQAMGDDEAAMKSLDRALIASQALSKRMMPARVAKEILGPMYKGFGGTLDQLNYRLAGLFNITRNAGATIEIFAKGAMNKLAQAGIRSGEGLESMAIGYTFAMRTLDKETRGSSEFLRFMAEMQSMPTKQAGYLAKLGLQPVDPVTGKPMSIKEFFRNMMLRFEENAPMLRGALINTFGQAAGMGLFGVLSGMRTYGQQKGIKPEDSWEHLQRIYRSGGSLMEEMAKRWQETPEASIEMLKETFEEFKKAIGMALLPAIQPVADMLRKVTEGLNWLASSRVGQFVLILSSRFLMLNAAVFAGKALIWGYSSILSVTRANLVGVGASLWNWIKGLRAAKTATVALTAAQTAAAAAPASNTALGLASTVLMPGAAAGAAGAVGRSTMAATPGAIRAAAAASAAASAAPAAGAAMASAGAAAATSWHPVLAILTAIVLLLPEIIKYGRKLYTDTMDTLVENRNKMLKWHGKELGVINDLWKKGTRVAMWGYPASMRKDIENYLNYEAKRREDMRRQEEEHAKRMADLERTTAFLSYAYLQQGTQAWDKVMQQAKELASFKSASFSYGAITAMKSQFLKAASMARTPEERTMALTGVGQMELLQAKSAEWVRLRRAGKDAPGSLVQAMVAAGVIGNIEAERLKKAGLISGGAPGTFRKKVLEGLQLTGERKNMEAITAASQTEDMGFTGEQPTNWAPNAVNTLREASTKGQGAREWLKQFVELNALIGEQIPTLKALTEALKDVHPDKLAAAGAEGNFWGVIPGE